MSDQLNLSNLGENEAAETSSDNVDVSYNDSIEVNGFRIEVKWVENLDRKAKGEYRVILPDLPEGEGVYINYESPTKHERANWIAFKGEELSIDPKLAQELFELAKKMAQRWDAETQAEVLFELQDLCRGSDSSVLEAIDRRFSIADRINGRNVGLHWPAFADEFVFWVEGLKSEDEHPIGFKLNRDKQEAIANYTKAKVLMAQSMDDKAIVSGLDNEFERYYYENQRGQGV